MGEPWTTVRRRRACSLESFSLEPVKKGQTKHNKFDGLTLDQVQAVRAAADNLTKSQKKVIEQRKKKMTHQRERSSSSRGEGASRPKGKGIDPREWGNVNISQESLDMEAQAAAFRSIAQERRINEQRGVKLVGRTHQADRRDQQSPPIRLPAESHPVAQLAQGSYLGMALQNVGRSMPNKESRRKGRPSPSPSQPSSSDEELFGSESSSLSGRTCRHRDNRHGRHRR